MQKNLAVIFGGVSVEHEISIITGVFAGNAASAKFNVIPIYITAQNEWFSGQSLLDIDFYNNFKPSSLQAAALLPGDSTLYLRKKNRLKPYKKIDCVLNCCHGSSGENGSLSGLFELCNIPSASPEVLGASVAMDKAVCKYIAKAIGLKVVPALKVAKVDYIKRGKVAEKYIQDKIGYPVIIKPVSLGSSIGISTATNTAELRRGLELAFNYDTQVLCEKLIENKKEINCAAYAYDGDVCVSRCDQPKLAGDFLSYDDKYLTELKERSVQETTFDEKVAQKIKSQTKLLYKKLNLNGIVRADFLVDEKDIYFNELNTVPGNLAFYLFLDDASDMCELIEKLVFEGINKQEQKNKLTRAFYGGVISKFSVKGAKHLKNY